MNNAKLRGRLLVFAFALLLICAFAVGLPAAERTNAEGGTKKTLSSASLSYQGQDNWYALTGDFDAGALYRMYRNNVGTAGGFGSWWQGYGNYANFIADQNYNCCYPVGSDAILAYVVPEYANVSLTGRIIGASARAIRTSVVYRRAGAQDLLLHSASVSNAAEEAVGVSAFHADAGDVLFFVAETDPSVAAWDGVIFDVEVSLTARSGHSDRPESALAMEAMPMTGAHSISVTGGVVDYHPILTESMKLDQTKAQQMCFMGTDGNFAAFGYNGTDYLLSDMTWAGCSTGIQEYRVFYSNDTWTGAAGMLCYAPADGKISLLGKAAVNPAASAKVYVLGESKREIASLGGGVYSFAEVAAVNEVEIKAGEALAVVFVAAPWNASSMAAAFDFYAAPAVAADTEGVPAHKLEHKEAKEATCREEGNREHYQCEICGKLYEDERGERETSAEEVRIAKKAHEEVKDEGREATCTEAGLTEGKHCRVCGEVTEEQKVIPAKGHREKTTAGKEATCTEAGLTEGKECEECGEVLKEQREVPALGHRLKYVAEEKATCTEDGMEAHYACERCGKKYREEGGKEEVSEEELKIASEGTEHQCQGEATCTQGQVCLICGAVVKEALGHDEVVTEGKEATCTRAGRSEAITCRRCGERLKESERIAAKGHEAVRDEGREATCTENGVTEGSHCERCGEVLEYQYPILAKGHAGEKTEGREATCTEAGLTSGVKCGVCGEILKEQREIAALGHSGSEATCTEDGICERCGIVTEEKKGHAYEEGPTCRERKCTRCGAVKEATGEHEGGEAKCGEQAICEKCGEGYGARKGHDYEKGTCVDCGAKILVISGKQSGCSSSLGVSSAAVSAAFLAAAALPVLKKRRRFHIRKGR